MKVEELIKQVDERIDTPFVTARFGNNWKNHQKQLLIEGQVDVDDLIDIAWRQGRRAILMEQLISQIINVKKIN